MPVLLKTPGDKRVFAAGLYWRHEDRKPSRKDLLAGSRGTDFWVVQRRTKSRSLQSGFTRPLLGSDFLLGAPKRLAQDKPYKGRVYSLAAAVADVIQEPWLGIFDLGNGLYWYIAVRDSYEILPDGDAVGDWDAVDALRRQHAAYGEPSTFRDGGLQEIGDILRQGPKVQPLVDIRKNPVVSVAIWSGVVTTAVVGGAVAWHIHERKLEQEKIAAQERRIAIERAIEARRAASKVLPWAAQPLPSNFIRACESVLKTVSPSDLGWLLKSTQCGIINDRLVLQNTWGIGPSATTLHAPDGALVDNGQEILSREVLQSISPSRDGNILPEALAEREIYGVAEALSLKVRLAASQPNVQKQLPGAKPVAARMPEHPWEHLNFSISGDFSHWGTPRDWDIPGLRFSSVTFSPSKTGGIQIKAIGVLYVLRDNATNNLHKTGTFPKTDVAANFSMRK
ncbi:type 4b pilus protein PilO2 [Acidithiobacillus caldus]